MQVPDAQQAVCDLLRVIFRIKAGGRLVLVLLIDVDHLIRYAVFQDLIVLELVQGLPQGVNPAFKLNVLFPDFFIHEDLRPCVPLKEKCQEQHDRQHGECGPSHTFVKCSSC